MLRLGLFFGEEIAYVSPCDEVKNVANEEHDPYEGSLDENRGCSVDHCLIVPKDVLKEGICALQPDDLFDPNTVTGCRYYRVNNTAESSKQEQHFKHEKYELFFERFLDIQVRKLFDDFILGQHHGIVGLSRLEVDHMADDEVYPEEDDQHHDAGDCDGCG